MGNSLFSLYCCEEIKAYPKFLSSSLCLLLEIGVNPGWQEQQQETNIVTGGEPHSWVTPRAVGTGTHLGALAPPAAVFGSMAGFALLSTCI